MTINSNSYWDSRFTENWEDCRGPAQSRFFAKIALEHLPKWLLSEIRRQSLTFADWGCAQGDGTDLWTNYLDTCHVVGVDFSSVAIRQATQRYPAIRFINEDWIKNYDIPSEKFDVVFSSNTLEHFYKPYEVLHCLCNRAKKAVILALPYREIDRIEEHFFSFLPENIPLRLNNGFRLLWSQIVDCRTLPNTLWGGDQIVLLFACPKWYDKVSLTLSDCRIEQNPNSQLIDALTQETSNQKEQISILEQVLTECQEQVARLNYEFGVREEEISRLNQMLAEREEAIVDGDGKLSALAHSMGALKEQLASAEMSLEMMLRSKSWRVTLPLRVFSSWLRPRIDSKNPTGKRTPQSAPSKYATLKVRLGCLFERVQNGICRHGFIRALPRAMRSASYGLLNNLKKKARSKIYEQRLRDLSVIIEAQKNFIDLFHVPMGWNTPLFQRFQHMSLQAANLGGLALYGGHPLVDKDIFVFENVKGNVVVFDALDKRVVECIFDAMRKVSIKKVLRLQSIDLVTTIEDISKFIDDGITVVYEYIDEINEDITGSIPELVLERHRSILVDERIIVVATSDKLLDDVKERRSKNCLLSTNGVDLQHWRVRPSIPPDDIKEILGSDRRIIGYHGALAKWIDYDLLRKIADTNLYEILLIGYAHDDSLDKSGLVNHSRIHFLGSKSYFDLNQYAAYYDIGILPFKRYALTDSVSPVKLFEYMAAGKPVVSTDLHECHKYASCLVSDSHDKFIANLHIAASLNKDAQFMTILSKDASLNSWSEKAAEVLSYAGVRFRECSN